MSRVTVQELEEKIISGSIRWDSLTRQQKERYAAIIIAQLSFDGMNQKSVVKLAKALQPRSGVMVRLFVSLSHMIWRWLGLRKYILDGSPVFIKNTLTAQERANTIPCQRYDPKEDASPELVALLRQTQPSVEQLEEQAKIDQEVCQRAKEKLNRWWKRNRQEKSLVKV